MYCLRFALCLAHLQTIQVLCYILPLHSVPVSIRNLNLKPGFVSSPLSILASAPYQISSKFFPDDPSLTSSFSEELSDSPSSEEDRMTTTFSPAIEMSQNKSRNSFNNTCIGFQIMDDDDSHRKGNGSVSHPWNTLRDFRFDPVVRKCAQVGLQGHCGTNMIFRAEIDSSERGYCECNFRRNSLPLVFHLESRSCFFLYTQAYCSPGEWLVWNRTEKQPICKENNCSRSKLVLLQQERQEVTATATPRKRQTRWRHQLSNGNTFSENRWNNVLVNETNDNDFSIGEDSAIHRHSELIEVPLNGNGPCVRLHASVKECEKGTVVKFSELQPVPKCSFPDDDEESDSTTLLRSGVSILPNPCPIGSYYSIIGRCQPDWDF